MSYSEFERDDRINCCENDIKKCLCFKTHGYNCFGLDQDGYKSPWGVIEKKRFDQLIKDQKIGPCKCVTDVGPEPCTCGIFTLDMGSDSKQVYLSNFTEKIRTNASHHQHIQSIYALEYGTEIKYQVPDVKHTYQILNNHGKKVYSTIWPGYVSNYLSGYGIRLESSWRSDIKKSGQLNIAGFTIKMI